MTDSPAADPALHRFTVLHHTGVEDPHYDLMFETSNSSPLVTFRLRTWPVFDNEPIRKLRDHRRAYLEYVGPVSGDRGRVDRVDEGVLHVRQLTHGGWQLDFEDGGPFATLEPVRGGEPDQWMLLYRGEIGA